METIPVDEKAGSALNCWTEKNKRIRQDDWAIDAIQKLIRTAPYFYGEQHNFVVNPKIACYVVGRLAIFHVPTHRLEFGRRSHANWLTRSAD